MKFCKDCRYCVRELRCHSPNNGLDLVTSNPRSRFASMNRDPSFTYEKTSGFNADWFKQKEVEEKKSFWTKIKECWNVK